MKKEQILVAMEKKANWIKSKYGKDTVFNEMKDVGGWDLVSKGIGGLYPQAFGRNPEITPEVSGGMEFASDYLVYYPRDKPNSDYIPGITSEILEFRYLNVKDLLARFFLTSHYERSNLSNWRSKCIGMPSLSGEQGPGGSFDMHMPMLDYDGSNVKSKIRKDVKLLQQSFNLGDAWVYKTRRGYHVYFLTDNIGKDLYMDVLQQVQCCKGFKKCTRDRGYAVLRVSAKYTDFDIGLQYVLASKTRSARRVTRKGHLIQRMIQMGQECGTHIASLFPDQALYEEDLKEWRPKNAKKGKRIRKVTHLPHAKGINIGAPAPGVGDPVHWTLKHGPFEGQTTTTSTTDTVSYTTGYNTSLYKAGVYTTNPAASYGPYSTGGKYGNK